MKIAVMSDVHGFSPALQAVLEDIRTQEIEQILVAGDICVGGPDPAGCIQLIREHNCSAVYGNTDRDVLQSNQDSEMQWTRSRLSESDVSWLQSLPFSIRMPHPHAGEDDSASDLLIVHANPLDVDRHLSPNASEREILEIIDGETARTITFGHLHVAYTRDVDGYTLVDVSAVGNPRDGDLRPRYVVFEPDAGSGNWNFEYHYLDYPLDLTRELMERSGMPDWERAWQRLTRAQYGRQI